VFNVSDENIKLQEGSIDLYGEDGEYSNYEFSAEELEEVYQAFLADVEEGNFKDYIYSRYTYDENRYDQNYFNTVSIEYTSREKKEDTNPQVGVAYKYTVSRDVVRSVGIEFDVNCKNIIAALIKTGAIDSEKDLTTVEEKSKLDTKNMEYEE
jgi:hypothetical protein